MRHLGIVVIPAVIAVIVQAMPKKIFFGAKLLQELGIFNRIDFIVAVVAKHVIVFSVHGGLDWLILVYESIVPYLFK
jgi:hypothetical protein